MVAGSPLRASLGEKGELDWERHRWRGFGLGRCPCTKDSLKHRLADHHCILVLSSDDPLLEVSAMCPKPIDEENLRSMGIPQVSYNGQCKNFPFFSLTYLHACLRLSQHDISIVLLVS